MVAWNQTKRARVYGIVWRGQKTPSSRLEVMLGHATCCVPLCPNNSKNSHGLAFHRIPEARRIRREYVRLLRKDNLNLNCDSTQICSTHWDGGEKSSRTHLPSIFSWSKKKREGRILYRSEATSNSRARKRNTDISCTEMDVEADSVNEASVEQIDVDAESNIVLPTLSLCDAETQTEITEEFLDRLQVELKSTGEERQISKRKRRVD